MELQSYVRTLRARWRGTLLVVVLAVAGAAAVSLLTTPTYAATTQLFVSTPGGNEAGGAYASGLYSQQRVASYAELLRGADLAQQVADRLQLPLSGAQLAGEVTVATSADTVLLDVTVTDPSAARAQAVANGVAEQFTTLVAQLETPAGSTVPNATVTVTQRAALPGAPVAPTTSRNLVLGLLVGLVLGVAQALVAERLDNTVKSGADLEEHARASLVGAVPYEPERTEHPLIDFADGFSASAEAYRQIRTNLQFLDVDHPPRVIVVTSAVPSEGKSVTALNLACVLAENGSRVLLVESDLRRPRLARYLRLTEGVGLTNVLSGSAELDDVLQETANPGVTLLGSGPHPPNPSELLGSSQMRARVQAFRERFDHVVFDGPPLLPVTDAAVLATLADGVLLVARHGSTKRDQVARAAENLRRVDGRILGTVLNMVPNRDTSEYDYAYYFEADPAAGPVVPEQSAGPASASPGVPAHAAAVVPVRRTPVTG